MTKVIISGQLSLDSSKSGRQYAVLDVEIPYPHEAQITIVPDNDEDSEEEFQNKLSPFYSKPVTVTCDVDESEGLKTTPSMIKLLNRSEMINPNSSNDALREAAKGLLDALEVQSDADNLFDAENAANQVITAKRRVSDALAAPAHGRQDELREALTPSCETKGAYMSEFSFNIADRDEDGEECERKVVVPWTTIKEIMAAISARADAALSKGASR